jgi:hypothetical protein
MKTLPIILLASFTLWLVLVSCIKKEAAPDCGCEGLTSQVVTDILGVYNATGTIVKLNESKQYTGEYTLSCNPDFVQGKVSNKDTVVFSGITHLPCYSDIVEYPGVIELTAIRKK